MQMLGLQETHQNDEQHIEDMRRPWLRDEIVARVFASVLPPGVEYFTSQADLYDWGKVKTAMGQPSGVSPRDFFTACIAESRPTNQQQASQNLDNCRALMRALPNDVFSMIFSTWMQITKNCVGLARETCPPIESAHRDRTVSVQL